MSAQVREQGRLPAAGRAGEADIAVATSRACVGEQFLQHRLGAAEHEAFAAFLDERLHRGVFLVELVELRRRLYAEFIFNRGEDVALDAVAERLEVEQALFVCFPARAVEKRLVLSVPDVTFQPREFDGFVAMLRFANGAGAGLVHQLRDRAVAKVEERVHFFAARVEDTKMNLVGRDGEFFAFRDRAVASAEHT